MTATEELLGPILQNVSRSFYLTLRWLPPEVRQSIGLLYLLARTTDTIADTSLIPADKRMLKLRQFRDRIRSEGAPMPDFSHLAREQKNNGEKALLMHSPEIISLLEQTSAFDRGQIQLTLETITRGQEQDLERFGDGSELKSLQTTEELDDYTYHVAGCVGEFWTHLTRHHCFPKAKLNDSQFLALAIRFGKALQLTNILRDLPGDLQQGRCYLPALDLAAADLEPTDLLSPANWPKLKPVFIPWLTKANEHFAAAWQYTLMIPHEHYRLRLACAWPILMGKRTLHLLQTGNPLDPAIKRKISRQEVRGIIWSTVWRAPFRGPWLRLFGNK
jgi:farnesyl-diphosphate farnesyltransferase